MTKTIAVDITTSVYWNPGNIKDDKDMTVTLDIFRNKNVLMKLRNNYIQVVVILPVLRPFLHRVVDASLVVEIEASVIQDSRTS